MKGVELNGMNGRVPSRNGRLSSQGGSKRNRKETLVDVAATILNSNGNSQEAVGRFSTMKKVAVEQRKRVRETREKQIEEEKIVIQTRKTEEMREKMRLVFDEMIESMKKDIFSQLDKRLSTEKEALKIQVVAELMEETNLAKEIEKRTSNGETFEAKCSRLQQEFEDSFSQVLKSEYAQVKDDVIASLDQKLERKRLKWEQSFKIEGMKRLKVTEDVVRTDFRVGLEDSQKQCSEILSSIDQKSASLEQKLTDRVALMDSEFVGNCQDLERKTRLHIINKLNERDKVLKELFEKEAEKVRKDVKSVRKDVSNLKSKVCVVL